MSKQDIYDTLYSSAKKLSTIKLITEIEKYFNDAKTGFHANWHENIIKAHWEGTSHTYKVVTPNDIKISAEWRENFIKWGDGAGGHTLKEISSINVYFRIGNKDIRYWISLNKVPTLHKYLNDDARYQLNYIGAGIYGKDFDYRKPDIAKEFEKLLYSDATKDFINGLLKNCSYPFVWKDPDEIEIESDESFRNRLNGILAKVHEGKSESAEV